MKRLQIFVWLLVLLLMVSQALHKRRIVNPADVGYKYNFEKLNDSLLDRSAADRFEYQHVHERSPNLAVSDIRFLGVAILNANEPSENFKLSMICEIYVMEPKWGT